jgi:hypothetical protein
MCTHLPQRVIHRQLQRLLRKHTQQVRLQPAVQTRRACAPTGHADRRRGAADASIAGMACRPHRVAGCAVPRATCRPHHGNGCGVAHIVCHPHRVTGCAVPHAACLPHRVTGFAVPRATCRPHRVAGCAVPRATCRPHRGNGCVIPHDACSPPPPPCLTLLCQDGAKRVQRVAVLDRRPRRALLLLLQPRLHQVQRAARGQR